MTDLCDLKAGDHVVVVSPYGSGYTVAVVDRVTPTQIVVGGCKYNKAMGREVGSSGWASSIITIAPHLFVEAKKQKADKGIRQGYSFNKGGVERARAAADYAEKILREIGRWDEAAIQAERTSDSEEHTE